MFGSKKILFGLMGLLLSTCALAGAYSIEGKVYDATTKEPLYYAVVNLVGTHIYGITTEEGDFVLENVPEGEYELWGSILSYATYKTEVNVKGDIKNLKILLQKSSLEMEEVVVTATTTQSDAGSTTYKMGDQAIQQIQAVSVNDILQLLPGAKVGQTDMNSNAQINLRDASGSSVNSFGTAIIVDGNQMSNDANMQAYNSALGSNGGNATANKGIDLRDIPAANIESVEVISGVASAKYGNITSGAVLINRKAGYTPLRVSFNSTPNMYQFSANKGFKLPARLGFLNMDGGYTYSNSKNTSDRNYYQRMNGGLRWTTELSKKMTWTNNMSLTYSYGSDGMRIDPDEVLVRAERENTNQNLSFSNNGSLNILGRTSYSFSVNYSHQYTKQRLLESGPIPVIESLEEGTFFVPYTENSFYQTTQLYGAPLNMNGRLEADQNFDTGFLKHKTNIGIEYTFNKNYGKGRVLEEGAAASSTGAGAREMNFYNLPASNTYSAYFQDNIGAKTEHVDYSLRLGLRYDNMIQRYNLIAPRTSFSALIDEKFRFRAAYGLSYKAPSMLQLYPGPAYFDIINLNHFANDESRQMAVVTTYIHQPTNEHLKPSKGETYELGFDYDGEKWGIRTTYFHKVLSDGISTYSQLKAFELVKWEVVTEYDDQWPEVAPTDESIYVSSRMNTYINAASRTTDGVEVSLRLPKFEPTNTSFNLSGSYLRTETYNDVPILKSSGSLTGSTDSRYGVYETPTYMTDVCRSNLTIVQHIPKIRLLATFIVEANWKYNYEVKELPSIYPLGYYTKQGNYITIPEEDRTNEALYGDLFGNEASYYNDPEPTYFNFHMQVRKETKQGHSFSFYANNFLWYTPMYTDVVSETKKYLNGRITFGFGMNFKI